MRAGGCTVGLQCGAKSLTVVTNPVGQFPFLLLYSSNFHTVKSFSSICRFDGV